MIKASDVIATVLELGRHNPNETRDCRYANYDGTPCCIVGTALIEHGMDPQVFLDDDELNRWTTAIELFMLEAERLDLEVDVPADRLGALVGTQRRQDHGDSWGVAIEELQGF